MDARIPVDEYAEFRAALIELAPDKAARDAMAERCQVHPKTILRLGQSLPSPLRPLICEPSLLRALLRDIESKQRAA
jgi:hypothetical protein